jgi:hypothetical protein
MYDDLYCQCFLRLDDIEKKGDLCIWLNRFFSGNIIPYPFDSIETSWCKIHMQKNKGYNMGDQSDPQDGFLYWRYFLDIEPSETTSESEYIRHLRQFIHELKNQGIGVVPACTFEDELL